MKTSVLDRRVLARLLRTLRELTPRRPRRALLEEAEIELWGLYRREQAGLLCRAAALRDPARSDAQPTCTPRASAQQHAASLDGEAVRAAQALDDPVDVQRARRDALRGWRELAAECAFVCACDGYPLTARLAECIARPVHSWPAAHVLAASARRLGAALD